MEINYTLTPEDYIQFNLKQFSQSNQLKKSMMIQLIIPILVAIALFLFRLFKKTLTTGFVIFIVAAIVLWPIVYTFFFKRTLRRRLEKITKEKAAELDLGPRKVFIDEHGLKEEKAILHFQDLIRIEETVGYFFFHQTEDLAYILPKRDLTDKQIEYIRATLRKIGVVSTPENQAQ